MSSYLDASVLIATLVEESTSAAVDAFLLGDEGELFVSDFAVAEVASGLSRLVRTGLLTEADATSRLDDLEVWRAGMASPIDLHPVDARLAYAYVRRFDLMLRAPDALHLAIARRLDATLVTLDRRMARAAAEFGITAHVPAAA